MVTTPATTPRRPPCHIITCEFPPQTGGVSDFCREIAAGLASRGTDVHVWSPAPAGPSPAITVHALAAGYSAGGLRALSKALDAQPAPRRLFVQWVPHGYGYKSLNLPFCLWVWNRSRRGDDVQLMVHEPFLPFALTRFRQSAGAVAHRLMLMVLLRAAGRVFVSTPSFVPRIRPFGPSGMSCTWLPIPSPVPGRVDAALVPERREGLAGAAPVVGYFGTSSPLVAEVLAAVLRGVVERRPGVKLLLVGRGTDALAAALGRYAETVAAVVAHGERPAAEVAALLRCCDVFVQPYPDGVTARRTTLMALLDHGCAVVASASDQTEPWWDGALELTPVGDVRRMVDAAVALLDSPERRARLSAAARRMYAERFAVDRALDLFEAKADG